jgi:hypothetical protein
MIENQLDVGGAVAFWTPSDATDRLKLYSAFVPLSLETFVPEPRPAASVLKDALEETLGGPRVLIRPLSDRDGFTVVREDRGRFGNSYLTSLVARVSVDDDIPTLQFEPNDERAALIQAAYRKHEGRVTAAQLSSCLVRVVNSLGGTRLRPTGAVYWIPGHKLADWAEVARAVESSAEGKPSAVYLLRHCLDIDAVRAVRDAVVAEVRSEANRIQEEVASGELGGRALAGRKKQARELRDKVLLYEDLLSVGLADLHVAVDHADQAAATAAMLLGAVRPNEAPVGTPE